MIEISRVKPSSEPVDDVIESFVEISLERPDDFLRVKETLTRIGVASRKNNTLWQSCHILHKRGKYYLVHFLEMFLLDGKEANITNKDIGRRNRIAQMLEEWSLLSVVTKDKIESPLVPFHEITVIPFKTKHMWTLVPKYSIGSK